MIQRFEPLSGGMFDSLQKEKNVIHHNCVMYVQKYSYFFFLLILLLIQYSFINQINTIHNKLFKEQFVFGMKFTIQYISSVIEEQFFRVWLCDNRFL